MYNNTHKLILSGFGGQGLMFLGKLIALAAMREGKFVTWFPAYGAEVRGGTAYCSVVVSEQEIASPMVGHPDIALAMNQPSLDKFEPAVVKNGLLFVNETLINRNPERKDLKVFLAPFSRIAADLGEVRIANMVALGSINEVVKLVSFKSIFSALDEMVPASRKFIMETNKKAIEEGRRLIK
jgi:2-oxoglutarate ferredoxin oxidoreductase subunit gamma